MDPVGPLRYKGLVTMPNAMGPVLADAFHKQDKDKIKLVVGAITSGSAVKWYTAQSQRDQIIYETQ